VISARKIRIKNSPGFTRLCLSLLILLYLTGSLQIDSIHRLFHAHENSAAHTEESEKNACHRTVFHQATQNTCDHPTHISELKKCPWCNGYLQFSDVLISTLEPLSFFPGQKFFTANSQNSSESDLAELPIRGPPTAASV
jgi:hypothetical protein